MKHNLIEKEKVPLDSREQITKSCHLRWFYDVDTSIYFPEHRYGQDTKNKTRTTDNLIYIYIKKKGFKIFKNSNNSFKKKIFLVWPHNMLYHIFCQYLIHFPSRLRRLTGELIISYAILLQKEAHRSSLRNHLLLFFTRYTNFRKMLI